MTRRQKLVWTPVERHLLIDHIVAQLKATGKPLKTAERGPSACQLLRDAQIAKLPPNRHRVVDQMCAFSWVYPAVEQAFGKTSQEPVEQATIQVEVDAHSILPKLSSEDLAVELLRRAFKFGNSVLASNRLADLEASFGLLGEAIVALSSKLPSQPKSTPIAVSEPGPQPAKDNKKKVLIVGLLPGQEHNVKNQFEDTFKLFFRKDQLHDLPYANKVFLTKFSSHSHESALRSHYGVERIEFVHGGMSGLNHALTKYRDRESKHDDAC